MAQYKNLTILSPTLDPSIQNGLAQIAGRNPFGEPLLLLEWGGTALRWPNGPLKYWNEKVNNEYHCIPRWFLSKWWSFEQVCPEGREWWDNNRYSNLDEAQPAGELPGVPLGTDLLGPPPLRGRYQCEFALPDGYKPDERLLDYVRFLKAQRDAAPDQSAMGEAQRIATIEAGVQADIDADAAERKEKRERFKEELKNELMPMAPKLGRTRARWNRGEHRNFSRGANYDPNYWPLASKQVESNIVLATDKDIKKYG